MADDFSEVVTGKARKSDLEKEGGVKPRKVQPKPPPSDKEPVWIPGTETPVPVKKDNLGA